MKVNSALLIDELTSSNFTAYRSIKKLGLTNEVHITRNGASALSYLYSYICANNHNAPELIMLSLDIPILDGHEFLQKLKEIGLKNLRSVKVIVTSGNIKNVDNSGINLVSIPKPVTAEKLMEIFSK